MGGLTPDQLTLKADEMDTWSPDCSTEEGKAQACMLAAINAGLNALDMYNGYPFASFDIPDTWTEDFEYEYTRGCYYYTENYPWTEYSNYAFYGGPNAGETVDGVLRELIDFDAFCTTTGSFRTLKTETKETLNEVAGSKKDSPILVGSLSAFIVLIVAISAVLLWRRCGGKSRAPAPALGDVSFTTYKTARDPTGKAFKHSILVEEGDIESTSYQQGDVEISHEKHDEHVTYF